MKSNLFLLGALTGLAAGNAAAATEGRPNVLFIAVDDLKPILGCYGDDMVKTPNIDRLASQGTVFLNAHCQQAVCGPSRASLMTGLRPDSTQVWDLKTLIRDKNPDVVTLSQYFKQNGYTSVGTGKIFDYRSVIGGHQTDDPASWSRPYVVFPKNPESEAGCLDPDFLKRANEAKARGVNGYALKKELGGTPPVEIHMDVPDNAYDDGLIAETGISLLNELAPKDKPFFLAVGFKKPHLPFVAPKKYADLYERSQFHTAEVKERPEGAPEYHWQPGWELRNGSYSDIPLIGDGGPIPEEMQITLIHGYYACVSYVDAQIGKLLDALEKSGEADNTVVVLWGDHGWHLGDHGMWCKHTNYEQATRSPLIIADLRSPTARKNSFPVEFVDIYPTLCELAGLPVPDVLQGDSLTPVLNGTQEAIKDVAVSQFPRNAPGHGEVMGYAYRDTRYRYIEWCAGDEVIDREFYDYQTDPQETRNLIDDPQYIREVNRMQTIADGLKHQEKKETVMKKKLLIPAVSALAAVTMGQNLISNADFAAGMDSWQIMDKKAPIEKTVQDGSLHLGITTASDVPSHRMLVQKNLSLESGTKYTLRFEGKAAAEGEIKVSIVPTVDYKAGHYGLMRGETLTPEWQTIEYTFRTKDIKADDPACLKIHLGLLGTDADLKNFSLTKK